MLRYVLQTGAGCSLRFENTPKMHPQARQQATKKARNGRVVAGSDHKAKKWCINETWAMDSSQIHGAYTYF